MKLSADEIILVQKALIVYTNVMRGKATVKALSSAAQKQAEEEAKAALILRDRITAL